MKSMIWASHDYEEAVRASGLKLTAGAEEVGRGCLAGPLTSSGYGCFAIRL